MKAKCAGLITVSGHEVADEAMKELKKFVTFAKYSVVTLESNNGGRETYVKVPPEDIDKARNMGRQMSKVLKNSTQTIS